MKLFNFLKRVKENKARVSEGKVNCIPLPFERLGERFPGIQQGKEFIVTANSGVGKTQLTKFLYVFWPYIWCKENPKSGITFRCFYFALEESEEEFIAVAYSFFLHHVYKITVDPNDLLSMYEELGDDVLELMEKLQPLMDDFFSRVTVLDSISNPYGIYKTLRDYSIENGTHYYYNFKDSDKEPITYDEYSKLYDKDGWAYSHYKPNNPNEYVVGIVDHISLITPEKGRSLHESMGMLSAEYGRKNITKHWNYIFGIVQQQNSKSEQLQFDFKGNSIISKLKPSLSELANNTETHRDALVCWTLFSPARYEIPSYRGFDIMKLKDNYRELTLEKNRGGEANLSVSLYFNGGANYFHELPKFEDTGIGEPSLDGMSIPNWYGRFKDNKEFWIKT